MGKKTTASPKTPTETKWQNVLDAHPSANEIYIGTNAEGIEQPFLERRHAANFAGDPNRVAKVSRYVEETADNIAPSGEDDGAGKGADDAAGDTKKGK